MNAATLNRSSEISRRVATGVIGAGGLLAIIIFGGWIGVFCFATMLSLGMTYEFSKMAFTLHDNTEKRYVSLSIAWIVAFINILIPRVEFELFTVCFIGVFGYFLYAARRHEREGLRDHFKELALSTFGIVYLAFLPLFLIRLSDQPSGTHWTVLTLIVTWAIDTGAYFSGMKYGKKRLYRHISPKKTVEGAIGGVVLAIIAALLFKLTFFRQMPWGATLAAPLLLGTMSQVGDLCESFLKRAFDVKDSGSILPGHGGLLDRFDGFVFSLPAMYACVRIFG